MSDAQLRERIDAMEKRLARLEDIDAIRRLKCEHALASDDHPNLAKRLLAIVTDDIEMDYGEEFGRFSGIDKLRELLADTPFPWTMHYMIPKRIDIAPDGRSATGIWYLWEPATAPDPATGKERAMWLGGVYEDSYRKQADGSWKISKLKLSMKLMCPYAEGWERARIVPLAASAWTESP